MSDYFSTKYDSAADEVISYLSSVSEGYGAEEGGDVESPYGLFALVILDDSCDLDFSDTSTNYPRGDLVGETAREYGVTADDVRGAHIVTTNSQGFVYVETFETEAEAREEYECRADAYSDGWEMTKVSKITVQLFAAERLRNSVNGNPRFRLYTNEGGFITQSDAACSYDVDNIVRKIPRGESVTVTLSLTRAGRVWNIERKG